MKQLKKIIGMFAILTFLMSLVPAVALMANADNEETGEIITSADMLHFKLKVRWGNVEGDAENVTETNFDGSIKVEDSARVSLENTLRFDTHGATGADAVGTTTPTSIPWKSLIYGDWDGVMVTISAPASSYVTINAGGNEIKKTAQEFYSNSEPVVKDAGSGREVIAQSYKVAKHPSYFLKVFWGKIERNSYGEECIPSANNNCAKTPLLNTAGSLKIDSGGKINLVKTLRFEPGDAITSKSNTMIAWKSWLYGGIDGILVHFKLNADELDKSDTVTINFDKHTAAGFPKSYSIVDLYHNGITKDVITSDGYGVVFEVWKRPNKSIIRVKGKPTVYVVEDGVKMPIQSPVVLSSNGLSFSDVEEVDQDEADTYANGDPLNYADGTMVREENKPEVYVVANGQKKHILDPVSFTNLGYNWNNVVVVPANSLGIFKNASPMNSNSTHPEGALIRVEGTPTVYVVEGAKKIPISDIQLFNARKYDWNKVLVVKPAQAAKFGISTQLAYPDGSLIKSGSGKVYVVDHGKKRWIRSSEDFTKGGYDSSSVLNVDDTAVNQLPEGNDVVADDVE